jgi:hypothetical protein
MLPLRKIARHAVSAGETQVINISIDMHRFGNPEDVYPLGRITIANDGTSTDPRRGNYNVTAYSKSGSKIREARVENWARLSRPVFELVGAALSGLGYK